MRNSSLIVTIIIVILIVGLGIYYFNRSDNSQVANVFNNMGNDITGTSTDQTASSTPAAITVVDQKPGTGVTVARVFLNKPGYVVIHADNAGKPGTILGNSAILKAGETKNVIVRLSSPTVSGRTYHAMVHIDNGDNVFSEDMDVSDVTAKFKVSSTATTTAAVTPGTASGQ